MKYGSVTKHWIGSTLHTYLSDPDDVKKLLEDQTSVDSCPMYHITDTLIGKSLLTSKGAVWQHRRNFLVIFDDKFIENNLEMFVSNTKQLVQQLKKKKQGDIINIYPDIYKNVIIVLLGVYSCNIVFKRNVSNITRN